MAYGDIYRFAHHTDHEHAAREHAHTAGWSHANDVEEYGRTADTELPNQFANVADVWHDAYHEGMDDFAAMLADEEAYGHDWSG